MTFKKDTHDLPLIGLCIIMVLTAAFNWNPAVMLVAALIALAVA